jgi:hypothetical protein
MKKQCVTVRAIEKNHLPPPVHRENSFPDDLVGRVPGRIFEEWWIEQFE